MDVLLEERVKNYLQALRTLRQRGLVVLHSSNLKKALNWLLDVARPGKCVVVSPKEVVSECPEECLCTSPGVYERVLGSEADVAVIVTDGLLRPNLLAALVGVVVSGGTLSVIAPPLEAWNPAPPGGSGGYREYLLSVFNRAPLIFWACLDEGKVILERLVEQSTREEGTVASLKPYKPLHGTPHQLLSLALTADQASALDAFSAFISSRNRTFLVTGDRGRGKSFLLGLSVALAIKRGAIGEAVVVAPSPLSLQSFFKGLTEGLNRLSIRYKTRRAHGDTIAVTGPWFRVAYYPLEDAKPATMLVIDEAGSVGVARLRRLSWRSGRVLVATTIHGYEGSGLVLARMIEDVLPRPIVRLQLESPIRYSSNDLIEKWSYEAFMLKHEHFKVEKLDGVTYTIISPRILATKPHLLRKIYNLLALAHYRTEPDYILTIMESKEHSIHALKCKEEIVAVADVAWEDWSNPPGGYLGLKVLSAHTSKALKLRGARIVRIAVHPDVQRQGLGRKLVQNIEAWAREKGADIIVAVFGRHDVLPFWIKLGYMPFYLSPRFNRYTGEKNIGVAKALSLSGSTALKEALEQLKLRLVFSSHALFRDVAAEKLALILRCLPQARLQVNLDSGQVRRLCLYLKGEINFEQALDAAFLASAKAILGSNDLNWLGEKQLTLLTARIIQGKTIEEASEICGLTVREAERELYLIMKVVCEKAGIKCNLVGESEKLLLD